MITPIDFLKIRKDKLELDLDISRMEGNVEYQSVLCHEIIDYERAITELTNLDCKR
jgi:hypothetical protein